MPQTSSATLCLFQGMDCTTPTVSSVSYFRFEAQTQHTCTARCRHATRETERETSDREALGDSINHPELDIIQATLFDLVQRKA